MKETRRLQTERAVQENLAGGGLEQILAADDFGDLHRRVVHYDRQLVSRNIIVPPDDEIAKIFSGDELLRAAVAIDEGNCFPVRHPETPAIFVICDLRFAIFPACARVNWF